MLSVSNYSFKGTLMCICMAEMLGLSIRNMKLFIESERESFGYFISH